MSWRAESTFAPSSVYCEDEKEFLKLAKKLREIVKLEEKVDAGEKLAENQLSKIQNKASFVAQLVQRAKKIPVKSDIWEKNRDVVQMLPRDQVKSVEQAMLVNAKRLEKRDQKKAEVVAMPRHDRAITCVCFDVSSGMVYTSSKDKYVLQWGAQNRSLRAVRTLAGHEGSVWCVDLADAGVVSGAADGCVCLWPTTGKSEILRPLKTNKLGGIVRALRHKDGRTVVSGDKLAESSPAYVAVIDADLKELWRQTKFPAKCNSVVWGSDNAKVFSAHQDGRVATWSSETGERLAVAQFHEGPIWSLSCTGDFVVTASQDKTAKILDVTGAEATPVRVVQSDRPLRSCIYDGFDKVVYAGGHEPRDVTTSKDLLENEFDIFIESQGAIASTFGKGHFGPVHQVIFTTPDCTSLFSISEDGCLKLWDADGSLTADDSL